MQRTLKLGLALLAAAGGGSACAMNSPNAPADAVHCSVEFAGKLPAGLTENAVCEAIRQTAAPALESARLAPASLSVKVRVESDSKVVATATLAGKALPEHRVAISDRALNVSAIQMLARAIAAEVASARQ